jgi:aminoglycoside 2'-N-acetyltransferase I
MPLSLKPAADLSAEEATALHSLNAAVYPPEIAEIWPGRSIEWVPAQWRVIDWDEFGKARCHVGIVLREGTVDDHPVKIGGIGGVMTHPHARRQGLASMAIGRAVEFFSEQWVDFGLLVCEAALVPFYERLDWRRYSDPLVVMQRGEKSTFTFNLPMVRAVCADVPQGGVIDLLGPPW